MTCKSETAAMTRQSAAVSIDHGAYVEERRFLSRRLKSNNQLNVYVDKRYIKKFQLISVCLYTMQKHFSAYDGVDAARTVCGTEVYLGTVH